MNEARSNRSLPWVPIALLAALLLLTPYAMSFPLSERAFSHAEEPLYAKRVTLIVFGLFACFSAAVDFATIPLRKRMEIESIAPRALLSLLGAWCVSGRPWRFSWARSGPEISHPDTAHKAA